MAKRKTRRSASTQPDANALARAPLPEQLAALQADRQWLLKQIRRKRTELDNFINQMRDLLSDLLARSSEIFQELQTIDEEIHALFDELLNGKGKGKGKGRRLRKREKQKVEQVYFALQMQGAISPRMKQGANPFGFEEDFFADDFDSEPPFGPGAAEASPGGDRGSGNSDAAPEPTPDAPPNQRDFRQTFLRLASIYHPDRAEDEDTQQQNTAIMQEINRAYKSGDFARLLELEQQQLGGETPEIDLSTDAEFKRECDRLTRENANLRDQYEGIKAELRKLRNETQEGMMLTACRKAIKEGFDPIEVMMDEIEMERETIVEIRDFVRDFRDRKLTLEEFLAGPGPSMSPEAEDAMLMLEQLLGGNMRIVVD